MLSKYLAPVIAFTLLTQVSADVALYGQCGLTYTGDTVCVTGAVCQYQNDYYSQCVAGTATTTATSTTTTKATTSTTTTKSTTSTSTTKATSTSTTATSTSTGSATGMEGYATLNGGTTGGAGGTTTTVTTLSALRAAVSGTAKKIVRLTTVIQGDGEVVDVGSNTSVLGSCGGGLTGSGFRVKESSNVIFRNLVLYKSLAPVDLIGLQVATNVWIDHNEFYSDMDHDKDYYDGQLDITHASDYISVTWNDFHDHWKVSLVGHSDSNGAEDTGHLRVTYAHNYFHTLNSRLPSLRFGTGHVYNNYYNNILDSCIDSRDGAQMLIENNVFVNAENVLETVLNGGYANPVGNDWGGATPELNQGTLTSMPYSYVLDSTASVAASVVAGAGRCKITV
ncbi:hypothetical protein FRB94_011070 [Tulasnella sp. JGI-2019a]|nr:hypothetical protein FRB93_006067 [Tulasnella sp. JGI-2019a]KAG8993060.1 hypothetical protein FRB94_011070 [Tulasnella sp. JGI-2019a]